jgi:hypothetical protein
LEKALTEKSPQIVFARVSDAQKRRLQWWAQQRYETEATVLRSLIMSLPKEGEPEKGAA